MRVHDHFDGSFHCVECGGKCVLSGDDEAITQLIRNLLEFCALQEKPWLPPFISAALGKCMPDGKVAEFWKRARNAMAYVRTGRL